MTFFWHMQVPSYTLLGLANAPVASNQSLELLSPFAEACAKSDYVAVYEIMKVGYKDEELANDVSKQASDSSLSSSYIHNLIGINLYLMHGLDFLIVCFLRQFCVQVWNSQNQETLNFKKLGDNAFQAKDFENAIVYYTQVLNKRADWTFNDRSVTFTQTDLLSMDLQFIDDGTMPSPTVLARRGLSYLMSNLLREAIRDAVQAQVLLPDWPTAFYLLAAALLKLGMNGEAHEMIKKGSRIEHKRNSRNWCMKWDAICLSTLLVLLSLQLHLISLFRENE